MLQSARLCDASRLCAPSPTRVTRARVSPTLFLYFAALYVLMSKSDFNSPGSIEEALKQPRNPRETSNAEADLDVAHYRTCPMSAVMLSLHLFARLALSLNRSSVTIPRPKASISIVNPFGQAALDAPRSGDCWRVRLAIV